MTLGFGKIQTAGFEVRNLTERNKLRKQLGYEFEVLNRYTLYADEKFLCTGTISAQDEDNLQNHVSSEVQRCVSRKNIPVESITVVLS